MIDRARDHRLQRLARARRVDDLELDPVFLEDAGLLAEIRDRGIPVAALADGQLEEIGGRSGRRQRAPSPLPPGRGSALSPASSFSTSSPFRAASRRSPPPNSRARPARRPPPPGRASTAAIAFSKVGTRSRALGDRVEADARPARVASAEQSMSGSEMRWPIQRFSGRPIADAGDALLMQLVVEERAVVADHEQQGNAVMHRGPDRGVAHHEVAVAADRDRQPARALERERRADRIAGPAADAAAALRADDSRADAGTARWRRSRTAADG